ncbi:MAG: hypothetical protein AAF907_12695 [Planctomycetota bacterium]
MSGHSFGAQTTQGVSGQSAPGLGDRFTDERIDAALILSPGPPQRGDLSAAFGSVSIPWMLMTGTKDDSPIGGTSPADRTKVFPHLPKTIDRYQLVLHEAGHSAFGDARAFGDVRNPNHHPAILALSTAFWDAALKGDKSAAAWLRGPAARKVLEEKDRYDCELADDARNRAAR